LKAAYRLLGCAEATFEAVAGERLRQTRQRAPGRYLVLAGSPSGAATPSIGTIPTPHSPLTTQSP